MKHVGYIIFLVFFWLGLSGQTCTMKIVHSKDYYTQPKSNVFQNSKETVMNSVQKTLDKLGYEIYRIDKYKGHFVTGWRPVEADSHYAKLFERKDYGVSDGAYYQLIIDLIDQGSNIRVAVSTTVKSIVGPLESSGKVEKRVLTQLQDYLRSPQIEMTNVGVEKK